VATGLNAHLWRSRGHFLKGKLLVERGEFTQGLLFARCFRDVGRTVAPVVSEFRSSRVGVAGQGGSTRLSCLGRREALPTRTGTGGIPELLRIKAKFLSSKTAISPSRRPKIS